MRGFIGTNIAFFPKEVDIWNKKAEKFPALRVTQGLKVFGHHVG